MVSEGTVRQGVVPTDRSAGPAAEDRDYRRNYRLGFINGIGIMLGWTFIDTGLVLPAFLRNLTRSNLVVGLAYAIMNAGWLWPQLVISAMVEHRPRKMPFYIFSTVTRIATLALIVGMLWLIGKDQPGVFLVVFMLLYLLHCSAMGVSGVPFYDIIGKIIPVEKRGNFFGSRRFWGGLLGFGGGFVVRYVLGKGDALPFPTNYGILFSLSFACLAVGAISFSFVREPTGRVSSRKVPFNRQMIRGARIVRRDRTYRALVWVRLLTGLGGIGGAFYVPFARDVLAIEEAMIGVFISVVTLAGVFSNLLWSRMSDRRGNRLVLLATALLAVFVPALAILSAHLPTSLMGLSLVNVRLLTYTAALALAGFAMSGQVLSSMNFLLEIAPERKRPTYIGFINTIGLPLTVLPLLGGLIADYISYEALFGIAFLLSVGTFIVTRQLPEPRRQ